MNSFTRAIKKKIEENCKNGVYADRFSPELQRKIRQCAEELAMDTTSDEDFLLALDFAIEESVRIMVLHHSEDEQSLLNA